MSMILSGKRFVYFPISIFMVAKDNCWDLSSVWSHVGVAFDSKVSYQRNIPGGLLGSELFILLGGY